MLVNSKLLYDTLFIYLVGELDECSAGKIRLEIDAFIESNMNVKKVVFNLGNLSFMDSTGIGLLIGRYKKLNSIGVKSYIENPMPSVQRVLELSGLYGLMPKIG